MLRGFVRRPRKVWLRRLSFQIHLWTGLILTLYLAVIGLTGSILVFREELENLAGVNPWSQTQFAGAAAAPTAALESVRKTFPNARVISLAVPTQANPVYVAVLRARGRYFGEASVAIHPGTAEILGRAPARLPRKWAWLGVVRNLHEMLLAGRVGRELNGALAGCLLAINLTGIVIWWPGAYRWTRALGVDFGRSWRRVNFDLHRAAGLWTLGIVSIWGLNFGDVGHPFATVLCTQRF